LTAVFALASHPLARIPDPSIGFQAGREAFGDEKIVSVLLPGERSGLQVRRQLAAAGPGRDQRVGAARTERGGTGIGRRPSGDCTL